MDRGAPRLDGYTDITQSTMQRCALQDKIIHKKTTFTPIPSSFDPGD